LLDHPDGPGRLGQVPIAGLFQGSPELAGIGPVSDNPLGPGLGSDGPGPGASRGVPGRGWAGPANRPAWRVPGAGYRFRRSGEAPV